MRNKLSGYSAYAFSADRVMQTSLVRAGKGPCMAREMYTLKYSEVL